MFEIIENILSEVNSMKRRNPSHMLWFRGECSTKFKLNSGLYRISKSSNDIRLIETQLYNAFINYGDSFCRIFMEHKSWNVLFLMQHYGLYTRMLDWTNSLITALYFATYQQKNEDACLWILDPIEINRNCIGLYAGEKIKDDINILSLETLPLNIKDQTEYFNNPRLCIGSFALVPRRNNDRLVSQNGFFTVQGTKDITLDNEYKDQIKKIIISSSDVKLIREYALLNGINYFALYGGIEGLCHYLKNELFNIHLSNL